MPISQFLDGRNVDPETRRVVGVAFELTLAALRVRRSDPAAARVASLIAGGWVFCCCKLSITD
jgi:hypothetical protein